MAFTMQGFGGSVLFTADAVVSGSGVKVRIYSMHIISGATAGIVQLRDGTAVGGTIRIKETGSVNTGKTIEYGGVGVLFENGCFYDEDANVTSALITFAVEN